MFETTYSSGVGSNLLCLKSHSFEKLCIQIFNFPMFVSKKDVDGNSNKYLKEIHLLQIDNICS